MKSDKRIRNQTIEDFGNQFNRFSNISDKYWSGEGHLKDLLGDCIDITDIEDQEIAEVGSGSGRYIKIFSKLKPKKIYAVEPSNSFDILKKNTSEINNLELINSTGSDFKLPNKIDYIFSLGVIHHIINPKDVVQNIYNHLKNDGIFVVSVYAKEKNKTLIFLLYLFSPLKYLGDNILSKISFFLNCILFIYTFFCRLIPLPLPMKNYLVNRFSKNSFYKQTEIVFDQLNPAYAKFYSRNDIIKLLEDSNFEIIKIYNSADNNWGVRAKKLSK